MLIGLMAFVLIAAPPGSDGSLAPWFHSLVQPHVGSKCCDIADCRNHPVRADGEHYFVFYEGHWLVVPDEVISDRIDNPTGDYVTCVQHDHWTAGTFDGPIVRCFIKPPRT